MNTRLSSGLSSVFTLTALCTILVGLTSCFFGGSGETEAVVYELPEGDVTTFEVASTLQEAGRHDEALLVYYEAIQADTISEVAAKAMSEIGGIYIELQEYDKAVDIYEKLLVRFPSFEKTELRTQGHYSLW